MRAAPLPTPLKIYGLSLFPSELVSLRRYAIIALVFNSLWSLVWTLTGSSASNLAEAMAGTGQQSSADMAGKLMSLVVMLGAFAMFGRYARAQLKPPSMDAVRCTPKQRSSPSIPFAASSNTTRNSPARTARAQRPQIATKQGHGTSTSARRISRSPRRRA